jgi:hypothetical protein
MNTKKRRRQERALARWQADLLTNKFERRKAYMLSQINILKIKLGVKA